MRQQRCEDHYMWLIVFRRYLDSTPSLGVKLVERLHGVYPTRLIGLGYLYLANSLAARDLISDHPFANEDGFEKLIEWLTATDEESSLVWLPVRALPYLRPRMRRRLCELAEIHPRLRVRLEIALSEALLGSGSAIEKLAEYCRDPRISLVSCQRLKDLNRSHLIPACANDPEFVALSVVYNHFHLQEMPDAGVGSVQLFDTREILWPPTNDRRTIWVYSFEYESTEATTTQSSENGAVVGGEAAAVRARRSPGERVEDILAELCSLDWSCPSEFELKWSPFCSQSFLGFIVSDLLGLQAE